MNNVGCHISFNGFSGSLEEAHRLGLDTFQIFIRNNRNGKQRDMSVQDINYFNSHLGLYGFSSFVVHAPYIINPASGEEEKREKARIILQKDLTLLQNLYGYKYMVVHPGSHTTYDRQVCLKHLFATIRSLLPYTQGTKLCIEIMAGQGGELMSNMNDINSFFANFRDVPDICLCLDTCHMFGAGIEFLEFLSYIKANHLEKHVGCLHLNGSLYPFGSHRDRHGTLEGGCLPIAYNIECTKAFQEMFPNNPIILETDETSILYDWSLVKSS